VRQLYKSHRTIGYELARISTADGQQLVLLETAFRKYAVSPSHLLSPISAEAALFDLRTEFAALLQRARFLEIDAETLRTLLAEEMMYEGETRARGA
jgi:hypothetical protein